VNVQFKRYMYHSDAPSAKKRKHHMADIARGAGAAVSGITGNGLPSAIGEGVGSLLDSMDVSEENEPRGDRIGGGGSGGRNPNRSYASPKFLNSFDVTVSKTTHVQVTDLGPKQCYFFPTGIYDWWLTEPFHAEDATAYRYQYIPGYVDLLFYRDFDSRQSRTDYFHFVRPNHGNVTISDITFFSDDAGDGAVPTLATYGFESGYFLYGERYLPDESYLKVVQPTATWMANDLLAKTTLPRAEETKCDLINSEKMVTVHAGTTFGFNVTFNSYLNGNGRWVKPLKNSYADRNEGKYVNFTWLPIRNKMFKSTHRAYDPSRMNAWTDDNTTWCNFQAFTHRGYTGPDREYPNAAHCLWFPRISKADSTTYKLRASFMMTTTAHFTLFSKFPIEPNSSGYQSIECHMGQLKNVDTYGWFNQYPITPSL